MLESTIWKRLAEDANLLSDNPSDESTRKSFWKSIEMLVDLRQKVEHDRETTPRLGKPCQRDPHPGFRCILAVGHPGSCVFEETDQESLASQKKHAL